MLYCCEECGKKFSTETEALNCEKVHAEEQAKQKELEKIKEDRANEIRDIYKNLNEKYKQYFKDYGVCPDLDRHSTLSPVDRFFISLF